MRTRFSSVALPCILLLGLTACDGGGVSNGGFDSNDVDTSTPPPPGAAPEVHATWSGEAVPGLTVMLSAEAAGDGTIVRWAWAQSQGPAVEVEDADQRSARFRVPPLNDDAALEFVVTATDDVGQSGSYALTVEVDAIELEELHIVEQEVTDQFVVFRADRDVDNRVDLYLATLDGTEIVRLNTPAVPGGDVLEFRISPDRQYVAYHSDQDTDNVFELYVARTDGGAAVKANGPLVAGGTVFSDFSWAPDSSRIAYESDQDTDNVFELYTSYPDGSGNVRVSGDLVPGGDVSLGSSRWHPDGSMIAYRADQFTVSDREIFASAADGGDNVRLSGPLVVNGDALEFDWSPDGRYLAYRASQVTAGVAELFTVEPDGQNNRRVSHPLPTGDVEAFRWAPDGSRLAYRAPGAAGTSNVFTVMPDGTGNRRISAGRGFRPGFLWSPDSAELAFRIDQDTAGVVELYVAGADGSANRRVSGPLVMDANVFNFDWSPDSGWLAYRSDQETVGVLELFVSAADGSSNVKVSGPLVTGGLVEGDVQWSPDGQWVAYRADQRVDDVTELFVSRPDGSFNRRVSGPLVAGGDVRKINNSPPHYDWSADSTRLVYLADQVVDERFELFVAAPDGNAINASLSGTLTGGGNVFFFALE